MQQAKHFILQCDIFSHGSLHRYKQEQSYRTLAGGIASIILIFFFSVVFANLVLSTFQKSIVISSEATVYHDDPQYSQITVDPSRNYMFAIGLTGIDLSSKQRYFDITLTNRTYAKNGSNTIKSSQTIPLVPCTAEQWAGVTDSISLTYKTQAFSQWLCPPSGTNISLEGKYSSPNFKFAQIVVSKCTQSPLFPNTTCKSSSDLSLFLQNNGQFTFNFYFINTIVNPENLQFVDYYLEDSNYFAFDTLTGGTANLYYNDFTVTTDTTILPWTELETFRGFVNDEMAIDQSFLITSANEYFRFHLRKAAYQFQYNRSFQKLDQTFSYIGGLFGTIVLMLLFLKIYSKYSYELNLGDKIFKQNNGGSFGSEHFNFIVFMGYVIYQILSRFGILKNWKTMKRYHECRTECQKQLNVDLLLQKLTHFEQIANILLEQHHLKMLMVVPKPTIKQVKITRKRYLMKSIVYHQLERKGRDIFVDQIQYKKRLRDFLRQKKDKDINEIMGQPDSGSQSSGSLRGLQQQMASSYKKLQSNLAENTISISKKIKDRLSVQDMATAIFDEIKPSFSAINNEMQIQSAASTTKQLNLDPNLHYDQTNSQMEMKQMKEMKESMGKLRLKRAPSHSGLIEE